jgi:ribosomal protein S27AE
MVRIVCGNCGGAFTREQVLNGKPPDPPKPLTPAGEAAKFDNETLGGKHHRCPSCGNPTLKVG